MLQLSVLLLVGLANPAGSAAQTTVDRESVSRVMEILIPSDWTRPGTEVARYQNVWSIVIARFAEGDRREILIPARVGGEYDVHGASESVGTDVDICVFGPQGDPVAWDTLEDNIPIAGFTAKAEGTYRAVMTAVKVDGAGTSFAGMVVLQRQDEENARPGGGK